jgi:hypothetical protein
MGSRATKWNGIEVPKGCADLLPLLGAAGGAVVIAIASERTGVDRKWVALGGASVGIAVASSTDGWLKQLATGVAAAGFVIAVVDYLRERAAAQAKITGDAVPAQETKAQTSPAPPPSEPAPAATAPAASGELTPEQLAKLQAIMEKLDPVEREQIAKLEESAPADLIHSLKKTLVGMSVDDAIEYLRRNLLATAHSQRRNGTHAPSVRS